MSYHHISEVTGTIIAVLLARTFFLYYNYELTQGVNFLVNYTKSYDENGDGEVSMDELMNDIWLVMLAALVIIFIVTKTFTMIGFFMKLVLSYRNIGVLMHRPDYQEGDEQLLQFFNTEYSRKGLASSEESPLPKSWFRSQSTRDVSISDIRLRNIEHVSSLIDSNADGETESLELLSKDINSWDFDVLRVGSVTKNPLTFVGYICLKAFDLPTKKTELANFLLAVEGSYKDVPYHNSLHGAQVGRSMYWLCTQGNLGQHLSALDQFTLVMAGLVHDVHHPGLTTDFIVRSAQDIQVDFKQKKKQATTDYLGLAVTYNDQSPLENMHLAITFDLLAKKDNHFFERHMVMQMRRPLVKAVLGTDMAHHDVSVTMLTMMNVNLRNASELNTSVVPWYYPHRPPSMPHSLSPTEKLEKQTQWLDRIRKEFVMELLLHAMDISSATMPFEQWCSWNDRVGEEFKCQKELEVQQFGEVISTFLPDYSDESAVHKFGAGFMSYMVKPLFDKLDELTNIEHPTCIASGVNLSNHCLQLKTNIGLWAKCDPDRPTKRNSIFKRAVNSVRITNRISYFDK